MERARAPDAPGAAQEHDGGWARRRSPLAWYALPLLVCLPLLALCLLVYGNERDARWALVRDQLAKAASIREAWLQTHLRSLERRARLVASRTQLRRDLAAYQEAPDGALLRRLETTLADALGADPSLTRIDLYDRSGARVLAVPEAPRDPRWEARIQQLTAAGRVIDVQAAPSGSGIRETATVPVILEGSTIGSVVLYTSGQELLKISADAVGMGASGEALLGFRDPEGELRFVGPVRFGAREPLSAARGVFGPLPDDLPLLDALAGREGFLPSARDYRGAPIVAAVRHVEETGWGLVVKMDRAEVFAPLVALRSHLLLAGTTTGSVLLLATVLLVRRLADRERELVAANARLRQTLVASPFPAMVHAEDGEVLLVSDSWLARTGYGRAEITTIADWAARAFGERAPQARARIDQVYGATGPLDVGAFSLRARDGRELRWEFRTMALGALADQRRTALSMAVDVTEREQLVDDLQRTSRQLRATIEALPLPFWLIDPAGVVRYLNPAAEATFGWQLRQVVGRALPIVPPERRGELAAHLDRIRSGEPFVGVEITRMHRDGTRIPALLHAAPVYDQEGSLEGCVLIYEDLRGHREREQELFLVRQAVASLSTGVTILDATQPDRPIVYANDAAAAITGHPVDELLGRRGCSFDGPGTDPTQRAHIERALQAGTRCRETVRHYRASGAPFWNQLTLEPVLDAAGTLTHIVATHEDVTEQLRLARDVEHRSRLAAVGELAGGVAHDFRNILSAMLGLTELALGERSIAGEAREHLEELRRLAARGAVVTEGLLAMSRKEVRERRPIDLRSELERSAALLARLVRDDVTVRLELGEGSPALLGDADRLATVMLNLVRNAEQAMPHGGEITILMDYPVRPGRASWWPADLLPESDRPWVLVTICDAGIGMDAATLARVFDPYFTTKPTGVGTGLGLPAVHAAVEQLGGRIWLDSAPGAGTRAHLLLPTTDALPAADRAPEPAPARDGSATRCATILLAEDDRTVRRVFERALTRAGHRVLVAEDGLAALDLFRAHADEVEVVLTDGVMPRLSGAGLARAVWERRADLPVIVTSGFTTDDLRETFPAAPPATLTFQPKPLAIATLLDAIQQALPTAGRPTAPVAADRHLP